MNTEDTIAAKIASRMLSAAWACAAPYFARIDNEEIYEAAFAVEKAILALEKCATRG